MNFFDLKYLSIYSFFLAKFEKKNKDWSYITRVTSRYFDKGHLEVIDM